MVKYRITLTALAAAAVLTASAPSLGASAITSPPRDLGPGVWRLGPDQDWKTISPDDKFLVAVAEAKKLVNTGQTESARKAYEKLKQDFPIHKPILLPFLPLFCLFCRQFAPLL